MKSRRLQVDRCEVRPGTKVRLDRWTTKGRAAYSTKEEYKETLGRLIEHLSVLQSRLYAADRYALLIILQALDAAGKDGVIKHVMSGINPEGVQVFSFKRPSATELQHDFLWRTTLCLPERGSIGVFNRSYYEEVLVVRVHPQILATQNLPREIADDDRIWQRRFKSINDFERHLYRNGTRILKFYLHMSKEEQRKRFLERIKDPDKNWKFRAADVEERKRWDDYMAAYEKCLTETSTRYAPWHVVPADDKRTAHLIVAQIVANHLRALHPDYPELPPEQKKDLQKIERMLSRESERGRSA
jgi:PPK2 family polyphosphate:nucleotide phosphotransferase